MNILFWITSAVEQAVLKGFAQAVAKLGLESDAESDPLAALTARIGQPAAIADEPNLNGDTAPARRRGR